MRETDPDSWLLKELPPKTDGESLLNEITRDRQDNKAMTKNSLVTLASL